MSNSYNGNAAGSVVETLPGESITPASSIPSGPKGTPAGGGMESIGSMEELRVKAPDVYKMTIQGIAMSIVHDMRHHQARLKQLMAEARRGASR